LYTSVDLLDLFVIESYSS